MSVISLAPERLAHPGTEYASAAMGQCQECGFCTLHCPTFLLLRDERDSPRGRVRFAAQIVEGGHPPTAEAVRHLDRCLSCLACSSACPFGVDHKRLWNESRAIIENSSARPAPTRFARRLLAGLLASPRLFRAMVGLAALGRVAWPILPAHLRRMLDIAPSGRPESGPLTCYAPAQGQRRMRVALLGGCVQQVLGRAINDATVRVLTRHGCEVIVPEGAGCCGAIALHLGQPDYAKRLASANVAAWERLETDGKLDAIVVNASGCGSVVKDYGALLSDRATSAAAGRLAPIVRDVSELLAELGIHYHNPWPSLRVALHVPCSMQHGQGLAMTPRRLLEEAGFEVHQSADSHICCGSAGTYNILQPQIADTLGRNKGQDLDRTGADVIATGNLGCQMHINRFARTPVVHFVELLDWASGGERPAVLPERRA